MPIGRGQRGKQQVRTGRVARLRNTRRWHHPPADARWRWHRLLIPATPALQLRACSLKITPLAAYNQHSALPPGHPARALGAVTVLMPEPRGIPQRACVLEQTALGRRKTRGVLVCEPRRILQPGRILVASASLLGRCRQHRRQPVLDALRNTQGASPERGPACGCSGSVLLAPDIIEQFMAGKQPRRLTLMWFQRNRLTVDWHAQRQLMATFEEDV